MYVPLVISRMSDPAAAQVREIFTDWAISGLLEPSLWMDIDQLNFVHHIGPTGRTRISTADWLTSEAGAVAKLQAFVFQPMLDPANVITLAELLAKSGDIASISPLFDSIINVLSPTMDANGHRPSSIFNHRLNVVGAPVESIAPNAPTIIVDSTSDGRFSHAAMTLATATGSWVGMTGSPVANVAAQAHSLGDTNIVMLRPFVRYVDASDIVAEIEQSIAPSADGMLPLAIDPANNLPFQQAEPGDASRFAELLANDFFTTHSDQLGFVRPKGPPRERLQAKSWWDALKLYFSFVAKWAWTDQGDWAREQLNSARLKVANFSQGFLGAESEYEVIVHGVSARPGNASSELDLGQELYNAASVGESGLQSLPPASPGSLWQELAATAAGFMDGGNPTGITLPATGSARIIVTDPRHVVPSIDDAFFSVPAGLPLSQSGNRLSSDDPLSAIALDNEIQTVLQSGNGVTPAAMSRLNTVRNELAEWSDGNNSFLWRVGHKLAQQLNLAREYARDMIRSSELTVKLADLVEAEKQAKRAIGRVLRGGLIILAVAGLAWLVQAIFLFIASGFWPVFASTWYIPVIIVALVLLVWNVVGFSLFNSAARSFFALEAEVKRQIEHARWVRQNRALIMGDLRRLSSYYIQFRKWVRILVPIIARPRTESITVEHQGVAPKHLMDLPRSIVVGQLDPNGADRKALIDAVRNSYFRQGWLYEAIEGYFGAHNFPANAVWTDTGHLNSSPLAILADGVTNDEASAVLLRRATADARELATAGNAMQLWPVVARGQGSAARSARDFLSQIAQESRELPVREFLTERGIVSHKGTVSVDDSWTGIDNRLPAPSISGMVASLVPAGSAARSFDFVAVRVEVSTVAPLEYFRFCGEPQAEGSADPAAAATAGRDDQIPDVQG